MHGCSVRECVRTGVERKRVAKSKAMTRLEINDNYSSSLISKIIFKFWIFFFPNLMLSEIKIF